MERIIKIKFAENLTLTDVASDVWRTARTIEINRYWSGENAPPERSATARMLWTSEFLFVRFDCQQCEPFVENEKPQTAVETDKLWENDVCELFLAPDAAQPESYFEFEIAPTGEWLDYKIKQLPDRRETDAGFDGMKTFVKKSENSFTAIFSVSFASIGKRPQNGTEWRGNFFRCIGAGATRGYLAWQPTKTGIPNFHVPNVFGILKFET